MPHTPELPQGICPGDILIVVHDFLARGADELTLRRGDKVELLELDEGFGDGWYLGKHVAENRTGLFPGVYTTTIPKLGVRQQATTASNSTIASKSRGNNESPVSPTALGATSEPASQTPNEDLNSQASRQFSGADFKPTAEDPTGDATIRLGQQQGPNISHRSSSAPLLPTVQRTVSETMSRRNGDDSPVLNETLSVINEHISNFNTPRHSVVAQDPRNPNDSGSEYSSHPDHRLSYIPGVETDEEEGGASLNEYTVRSWDHHQTARHLQHLGMDPNHCQIFEEQEITGDVLLEMDQEFIYMKEFNFGVMGKRLKSWHIIKSFQEEIKGIRQPRQSSSTFSGRDRSSEEFDRSQSRAGGSLLPRIPSINESPSHSSRRPRSASRKHSSGTTVSASSTPSSNAASVPPLNQSVGLSGSSRPSAASVRQINYPRPHSSMDGSQASPNQRTRSAHGAPRGKKTSFDRGWTMATGSQAVNNQPENLVSASYNSESFLQRTLDPLSNNESDSSLIVDSADLDRGYFSGGEIDVRKSRKVLTKRDSTSIGEDLKQVRASRHSHFGSDPRDFVPHIPNKLNQSSPSSTKFSDKDVYSKESFGDLAHAPPVTNLEEKNTSSSSGIFSALSPLHTKTNGESSGRSSPLPSSHLKNVAPKVRRALGLRAVSDSVTGNEKTMALSSPTSASTSKDSQKSPSRTNSSTPSGTSKSFEMESTDSSTKTVEGGFALVTMPKASNPRSKSKKDTSAYMRGLEKKTPQEQMIGCDYYGWMKKKSSNLMTTWKPRLFVLRGRRLSYYYSEDDTEERGLIDISSHRVFRADQDTITALHATLTGATASPTSPSNWNNGNAPAEADSLSNMSQSSPSDAPFIFKLVPPKAGLSRAVQFTKPSVHFFQVDNIQQGRLWMAALMKATIERDLNLPVKTTNKQKTISLKQARATNQRPPALMGPESMEKKLSSPSSKSNTDGTNGDQVTGGLNIIESLEESIDRNEPEPELTTVEAGGSESSEPIPVSILSSNQEIASQ
ncbi:conserved hypothetical protein [Histoplasma capsulatum G186AR]|uniref:Polarized growth protein n=2 Tax=Ajellomyces capsulatus TaxID=5037 RepID=C0NBF6_AJECG|nr:uncharacterized protein HCBG_00452 [Histoplasma capsulatum G186AR]EEH10997.1 conserved hypothetical protein [Histoplasma capsulatum G186AR]KAG5303154.1 polarized growth protein [Histoplasma capsulatum]QSS71444.1 polarized growth protein [Histoplasma capsulatum G186AR]